MHRGPITAVLPSKNDKLVYTAGYDCCIYTWNRETRKSVLLGTHNHLVNSLAISNDGNTLASSSADYSINLYNLETNEKITTLYGHADDVESLAFSDDNKKLVSTSRDYRCLVWDVKTGTIINEFKGHTKDVLSVWLYNEKAFTTGDDGRALIWNMNTSEIIGEIGPFDCELDTVSGSNLREAFAIGSDDGKVLIYDANTFKLLLEFQAHKQGVKRVTFSPSGKYVLTAGYDHRIKIWDSFNGKLIKELPSYKYQWERCLSWTNDEKNIIGSSFGVSYCEWDLEKGELVSPQIELATPSINDIAVTEKGIVTASDDGRFRINGKEIIESTGILTNGLDATKNGTYVLWGDHASEIHLLNTKDNTVSKSELNSGPINSIYFNEYDNMFYVGTYGGYIHVFDPSKKVEISQWKAHNGAVKAVQADNNVIVSVSSDGSIHLFDKYTRDFKRSFIGPTAIVNDVFLDSKRNHLVVVSRDTVVRVFNLTSGEIVAQHNQHRYSIKSVTVSEQGTIITGDYWGFCVFWNKDLNELSEPIRVGNNGISSLRSMDNFIYAGSYDGSVYKISENKEFRKELTLFEQQSHVLV
ncbi:WD40 repeat domain-containing protein [Bacillus wiedmannii]|uniref:WD40 repeat domain-containing protein n=1 Tax=Bacillus wiedmannii TaxID=1890302 RepID=UPI000BF75814|nr:WD40 repeat domain-containing protein [Bacillus wiedmannii]PFY98327.1 wd domain protein [Bacillus wiedmannii]